MEIYPYSTCAMSFIHLRMYHFQSVSGFQQLCKNLCILSGKQKPMQQS